MAQSVGCEQIGLATALKIPGVVWVTHPRILFEFPREKSIKIDSSNFFKQFQLCQSFHFQRNAMSARGYSRSMTMRTFHRPNGEKHNGLRFAMKSVAKSVSFLLQTPNLIQFVRCYFFTLSFNAVLRDYCIKTLIRPINPNFCPST